MAKKQAPWIGSLRDGLFGQLGQGWSVRDIRGRIQLTVRFADGQRSSVVTDLPWVGSSQVPLVSLASKIKPLVLEKGKTVKDAYALVTVANTHTKGDGPTNWSLIAQKFEEHKTGSGEISQRTWLRNYRLRVARAVEILTGKSAPTSGKGVLEEIVNRYFPGGKSSGETDRRLAIQYVAAMLNWAVDEQGVDSRWQVDCALKTFIGIKQKGHTLTTYIKDDQIVRLLDAIENQQWKNAVAMVACFGLRPVELHTLSVNGSCLHVGWQKRTARKPSGTDARDVPGLDPVGLEGLSANLLAQLAEQGLKMLPAACRHQQCGDRLHQYLERHPTWEALVAEVAAVPAKGRTGNVLVPYSIRHAYSARAEEVYGISDRRSAEHMGHSLQTHHSHYSGTGADSLERTLQQVAATQARRKVEALEALV